MTTELDLESLSNELNSLTQLVKTRMTDKADAERTSILAEIKSLNEVLGEDFIEEEYKDMDTTALGFTLKGLKRAVEIVKKTTGASNTAGLISRSDNETSLSNEELEDILTDMVSLAFNLPIATDEVKKNIRYERMDHGYYLR